MQARAVAVREAATVMLVRDAPDLEVFMVRRSPRASFVPGAHVFPGGQVDLADADVRLHDRAGGLDVVAADGRLGQRGAARFWVAAVRETFEEAGVLLARRRDGGPVGRGDVARSALATDRARLQHRSADLVDVLDAHDAVLDLGALVPFGRWITPMGGSRRFDTWFFVARAPDDQEYSHDDGEVVASEWVRPERALARAHTGDIDLIYPTFRSLLMMRRFRSADALLDAARARWREPGALREMDADQGWQLDLATDDEHRADDDESSVVPRVSCLT